jgi:SecD/SecF fusion protein
LPAARALRTAPGQAPTVTLSQADSKKIDGLNDEIEAFNAFLAQAELKMTGSDLKTNARGGLDPTGAGGAQVSLEFTAEGARKFADFTKEHTSEILMAYLDGRIISAPNINEPILNGQAQISPFPTVQEAQTLANYLNGGALPVPLKIVQQQRIEPTLGQDAVQRGLVAGAVGMGLVLVFMAGYYLLPGAVACVALILYTLLTYAIFLLIPVTFTLPGIAGFILSVGMAVDANVLIFERTKEELRSGRNLRQSVEAGFSRAFSAIFDANICTAITSLFLYNFGTGPVRGFALTLLIGVAVSMFTAITVSRTLLLLLVRTRAGQNLQAWGVNRVWSPRLNVVSKRSRYYVLSVAVIVPGLIFAFMGGFKPGIEFTGGSEMTLRFARPQGITRGAIEQAVAAQGVRDPIAQIAEDGIVFVRVPQENGRQISGSEAARIVEGLNTRFNGVTQEGFESIGSSISRELTRNAVTAITLSSIFILLYLASRFAIGGFVNGLKFGTCAIITMLHDVALLVGAFVVLGYFLQLED